MGSRLDSDLAGRRRVGAMAVQNLNAERLAQARRLVVKIGSTLFVDQKTGTYNAHGSRRFAPMWQRCAPVGRRLSSYPLELLR
ncbi:MAG: hypothetical protein CM1200mP36_11430 [Gammaproteobacteria bacterium]|nr:MAG: hypothetical protein CM1200mP36_11430 [Gammaproteobacteria bacterium]